MYATNKKKKGIVNKKDTTNNKDATKQMVEKS